MGRLIVRGLAAILAAVAANLVAFWVGITVLDIPSEFPPLAGPGPTIFFTAAGGLGAVVVFALVRAFSDSPVRVFRVTAVTVLLLSFLPDLWLLSGGAETAFPGATLSGVALLMVMHVTAAVVLLWVLTGSVGPGVFRQRESPRNP